MALIINKLSPSKILWMPRKWKINRSKRSTSQRTSKQTLSKHSHFQALRRKARGSQNKIWILSLWRSWTSKLRTSSFLQRSSRAATFWILRTLTTRSFSISWTSSGARTKVGLIRQKRSSRSRISLIQPKQCLTRHARQSTWMTRSSARSLSVAFRTTLIWTISATISSSTASCRTALSWKTRGLKSRVALASSPILLCDPSMRSWDFTMTTTSKANGSNASPPSLRMSCKPKKRSARWSLWPRPRSQLLSSVMTTCKTSSTSSSSSSNYAIKRWQSS